jgi:DNA processing protein
MSINKDLQNTLLSVALTKIPTIGAVTARTLISYCSGVENVFMADKKLLLTIPGIGEATVKQIFENKDNAMKLAEKELEFCTKNNVQIISYMEKSYPQRLKNFDESPILFYYSGTSDLNHPRTVGIIGTRKPTPMGEAICEQIVEGLRKYNPIIISGLAFGIDITAHKKALQCGMETIGIMGTGMDKIYPSAHRKTAKDMLSQGGLISEFGHDVKLNPDLFPARNRIIAALSDAVIVIESAISGGSMITANMAFDYNKDIFAVPGRLNDTYSQGCNKLIKINKANLIESAEDVAYYTRWQELDSAKSIQQQLFIEYTEDEKYIVEIIKQNPEIAIDALISISKKNPSHVASQLLTLEFKGVLKNLPGKRYVVVV